MQLNAVFFDHDGTLVDSEPSHFQMWRQVLAHYGVPLSEEQYKNYYAGVPTAANAVDMVKRFALPERHTALAEAKNLATRAFLSKSAFPLMPDAKETLALFHSRGLQLAVVTGASRIGVQATIRAYSLHDYFATVVSGDDVRQSKPAPDCYLLAIRLLGVESAECIAIEDTEHGVNAANAAGLACLAVPTMMSKHQDFSRATGLFGSLGEAAAWIENRFALRR